MTDTSLNPNSPDGKPARTANLRCTDPEFVALFDSFVTNDVEKITKLDVKTRYIAILAAVMGCQGTDEFQILLPVAVEEGVTPVAIKEIIYQGAAYLGIARVLPFLKIANDELSFANVELPLEGQSTTTSADRREKGTAAQVEIFGPQMENFWKSGPEESRHINLWLAENCFGDYYTRTGLDLKTRELITFCFLAAQGGCDPQLKSHAAGNLHVGNDKALLIDVISQCLPYIGYPRSLNALACVREAAKGQAE